MRSRSLRLLVLVLAVGGLLAVGVTGVVADEQADEQEIIEVQSVTNAPEQGVAHVELRYHLGDDVAGFQTQLLDSGDEVVALHGFDPTGAENEYEWDETTANPTIEVRTSVNKSNPRVKGYDYVDAGDWLLTNRPLRTSLRWSAINPSEIDVTRTVEAGEQGVASDGMVYLGPYDEYEFTAEDEQFRLVMTEAADPDWTAPEIGQRLVQSSTDFDPAGKSDLLTVFVVTDPLRLGGLATGTNTDFWVHEAGLTAPQTTLYHEYVHSRQDYKRTAAVEWTIEGSADYYGFLFALQTGTIEYHRFYDLLDRGNSYDDVILADPGTWRGTSADYELGSLTIAAMDRRLRADGGRFEELLRVKNEAGGTISDADFEAFATETGADMSDFFDQRIRSTPPPTTVPRPTVYDGPNVGATVSVSVPELEVEPGESERVTVELENSGTETSLAPELIVETPDDVSASLLDSDGSGVTETDAGWVFDHLPAGERYELTVDVEAERVEGQQVEFSVADLSSQKDSTTVTLDSKEPLVTTLDLPETAEEGDSITAVATATLAEDDIEQYEFTITGPDTAERIESGNSSATFSAAEPGDWTVSVTVTATDGRTATATGTVDVAAPETDDGTNEDDSTDETDDDSGDSEDDGTTDGDSDETTDGDSDGMTDGGSDGGTSDESGEETDTGSESSADEEVTSDDASGNGFGPMIVVAGVFLLSLVVGSHSHRKH